MLPKMQQNAPECKIVQYSIEKSEIVQYSTEKREKCEITLIISNVGNN